MDFEERALRRKEEIYEGIIAGFFAFLPSVYSMNEETDPRKKAKAEADLAKGMMSFVTDTQRKLMLYGSAETLALWRDFLAEARASKGGSPHYILSFDALILQMRLELGQDNAGLDVGDFVSAMIGR